MAKDQTNQQPDVIPGGSAGTEIHPKALLEAISFIDQQFANEVGGCMTNSRFLNTKQRIEFMEVGFRSSFASGTITGLLTPIAIGCIERYIPIFGNMKPSPIDQFCALLLALCFSIGYALFLSKAATSYIGEYTRSMVRNLLGGMSFGAGLKAVILFGVFHAMYFFLFNDENVLWISVNFYFSCVIMLSSVPFFFHVGSACQNRQFYKAFTILLKFIALCLLCYFLYKLISSNQAVMAVVSNYIHPLPSEKIMSIYYWLQGFKSILLTSAYFVLISTVIFVAIPFCAYFWAARRNRRLFKSGIIQPESRAF